MTEQISNAGTTDREATAENDYVKMKEWAILVYLGGENNLFDEMIFAVKEMKNSVVPKQSLKQQSTRPEFNFHALVQFAAEETSRPSSAFPLPRRFILKPGGKDGDLGDDYDHTPIQSTDPGQCQKPSSPIEAYKRELIDFLVWGISKGKARHYMVIFSGHGLGIESDFMTKDSTPPQSLTVKDIREVLRDQRVLDALDKVGKSTIDILGLDSCLMAMAEVGYELRREVPLMIASQGSQANLGWPYKSIFASLHEDLGKNSHVSPENLATDIVNKFVAYYDDFACAADSSADIAACRLRDDKHDYMKELKKAVDELASVFLDIIQVTDYQKFIWEPAANEFARALIFAHWYAQTYHFDQYVDIQDLCNILVKSLPHCNKHDHDKHDHDKHDCEKYKVIKQKCECVEKRVSACVISSATRRFSGPLYQYSNGISIYFPWSDIYQLYDAERLDFLKEGKWYEFIKAYTIFTRRPPKKSEAIDERYEGSKDSPPHSKGIDDPSLRAKNPPSLWMSSGSYDCKLKQPPVEAE